MNNLQETILQTMLKHLNGGLSPAIIAGSLRADIADVAAVLSAYKNVCQKRKEYAAQLKGLFSMPMTTVTSDKPVGIDLPAQPAVTNTEAKGEKKEDIIPIVNGEKYILLNILRYKIMRLLIQGKNGFPKLTRSEILERLLNNGIKTYATQLRVALGQLLERELIVVNCLDNTPFYSFNTANHSDQDVFQMSDDPKLDILVLKEAFLTTAGLQKRSFAKLVNLHDHYHERLVRESVDNLFAAGLLTKESVTRPISRKQPALRDARKTVYAYFITAKGMYCFIFCTM